MGILFKNPEDINKFATKLGATYYLDPETGYKVFTTYFLKKRGFCCEQSCRHCPYKSKQNEELTESSNDSSAKCNDLTEPEKNVKLEP